MGLSTEQVRIRNAETVAWCIGYAQVDIKDCAALLARRGMTTEVNLLVTAWQELEKLKVALMGETPYGRTQP